MKDHKNRQGLLLNQDQSKSYVRHDITMPGPKAVAARPKPSLGPLTVRPNHGMDHGPSFSNPIGDAEAKAHMHCENPFYWSGKPNKGIAK